MGDPFGSWSIRFLKETYSGNVVVERKIQIQGDDPLTLEKNKPLYAFTNMRVNRNPGDNPSLLPREPISFQRIEAPGGKFLGFYCCARPGRLVIIMYAPNIAQTAPGVNIGIFYINLR